MMSWNLTSKKIPTETEYEVWKLLSCTVSNKNTHLADFEICAFSRISPEPLFSGKTAFLKISADFVTGFQKLFFHLKALQTRMQINVDNFL